MIKIEMITFHGWKDCIRMSNGIIELIAATVIGPRIIHFSFINEENVFYENKEQSGLTGGSEWRIYGGHRLWHGPQAGNRPQEPDNERVTYEILSDGFMLTGKKEAVSGMRKQMIVTMHDDKAMVQVEHKIINESVWPVTLTAWAISVMRQKGKAVWPDKKADTLYLPSNSLVTWPYTDILDSRFKIFGDYMELKQDTDIKEWFKAGTINREGKASYMMGGTLFTKEWDYIDGMDYSDLGCSFEIYADENVLELESLSPLLLLEPWKEAVHIEKWKLEYVTINR